MLSLIKGRSLMLLCALAASASDALGQTAVRINEVMANNNTVITEDGLICDWIELVNTSAVPVNLSGASLTDDELDSTKWLFPTGTSIPANGFLVITFDNQRAPSFDPAPIMNTGFSLGSAGGGVFFFATNFGNLIDSVVYGLQVSDLSIGKVSGTWKLCAPTPKAANTATTLGPVSSLRINEWMANPAAGDNDFFELINTGTLPVSLEGLSLSDDTQDPQKSPIPALSFIGTGLNRYATFIADSDPEDGADHVAFGLGAAGDKILLYDALNTQITAVVFEAQQLGVSEGRLPDGSASITRFPGTASPGAANYRLIDKLYVSELLSHTDPPLEDAVEFSNDSDVDIPIGGWFLSNSESDLKRYRIPDGTKIPAKGFKVIYESAFNQNNPLVPFTFNSARGDQVYLAQADAAGNLTGYRVGEEFEPAENGVSFGRVVTSIPGDHKFVAMASRTFGVDNPLSVEDFERGTGLANSAPRVGPLIINEVHFNPPSVDGITDNREDEFIEIHNISNTAQVLYDPEHPENRWRLQNGVSFVFPANKSVPANGFVLVVSFDPTFDPIAASNFKQKFNVPAGVTLYGPFGGDLNNNGDALELNKPDPPQGLGHPDAGLVPYIRVDKVNYTDRAPWYPTADGTGPSLQRKNPRTFGNDPVNWDAAAPTPGRANSAELADADGDGMPDVWEDRYGFDKNNPADATLDFDNDGHKNREEYVAGTDPKAALSRLRVTSVVPSQGELVPLTLSFAAAEGKTYSVLYRNGLAVSDNWRKLQNVPADIAREVTVEDGGAWERTNRFYVVVTPAVD